MDNFPSNGSVLKSY